MFPLVPSSVDMGFQYSSLKFVNHFNTRQCFEFLDLFYIPYIHFNLFLLCMKVLYMCNLKIYII